MTFFKNYFGHHVNLKVTNMKKKVSKYEKKGV